MTPAAHLDLKPRRRPRGWWLAGLLVALALAALAAIYHRQLPDLTLPRAVQIARELLQVFQVDVGAVEGAACYWRATDELEWTSTAVVRVADTVGGPAAFVTTLGGLVRMARVPVPELRAFAPPVGQDVLGDIVLTDYNFDHGADYAIYLIVHEIGHVLDWRSHKHLSQTVSAETGASQCDLDNPSVACVFDTQRAVEPPPGNPAEPYAGVSTEEYWAEVFATTVYPEYYGQSTANNLVGPQTADVVKTTLRGLGAE